ncbi:hypothetical protein R1flu_004574 [Riccia fluitans]|uniref:Tetratricopeptide repeat protein n=1 Tax=Riccia fluitans TaxID=41844 RepID=A0ABD1YQQ7_9MARC
MTCCAHPCALWTPTLQSNADLSSGFFCSRQLSNARSQSRTGEMILTSAFPFSTLKSSSLRSNGIRCEIGCPQYHQSKRIELRQSRMILQDGELRFRKSFKAFESEADSKKLKAEVSSSQTRRNVLLSSASAVLGVVNYLGNSRSAEARVQQRVRLKDVDDQKLQEALRAAVAGDLENAEYLFTELIKEEPSSASVWSNRGSVRVSLGKFQLAAEDFTKAIELAPDAPVPFLNRAISYEALGRYEEAIADCRTAIENDPEEFAAWYNLGNVEVRIKDYDSALQAYERASLLAPGIAGYRFKQALLLFQVGRGEEAKKLLQGLVRKYSNYAEAHAALAAVLWNAGSRSGAEEQYTEATNREPQFKDLSWISRELQWPPAILDAYSKFLAIDYK